MNKKGQAGTIGLVMIVTITVIVGLVLLTGTAPFIGTATQTGTFTGQVTPSGLLPGIDLTGQELITLTSVINGSGAAVDCTANFTIAEGVSPRTGTKRIIMQNTSLGTQACGNGGAASKINLTYTYGPEGYIDDAGGRAIAPLILIFFALAIAVVALIPSLRSGLKDFIGM